MINYIISLIDYPNKLKVLKFFKKNLNNDFLNIIDIGGHKGETLEFFLDNFNVNKIFVFEPNKELFEYIKKKFNDKNISNLDLLINKIDKLNKIRSFKKNTKEIDGKGLFRVNKILIDYING